MKQAASPVITQLSPAKRDAAYDQSRTTWTSDTGAAEESIAGVLSALARYLPNAPSGPNSRIVS